MAAAEKDPNSTLHYFRKLVQLRKDKKDILVYGKYTLLDKENPNVYSYTRESNGKKMLILLNFKTENAAAHTGLDLSKARVIVDNYPAPSATEELRPYEARILELD